MCVYCHGLCRSQAINEETKKGWVAPGSIGRQSEVQKVINQEARLTQGAFRTTNQGALSLESGLNRQRCNWTTAYVGSTSDSPACPRATRPGRSSGYRTAPSDKGSSPTSDAGTAEKRRFSSTWLPHWGRPSHRGRRGCRQRSKADRPTRIHSLHGRVPPGERRNRLRRRLEEGTNAEGPQDPHGLGTGGIRRRMRCHCNSTASGSNQESHAKHGNLLRRAGGHPPTTPGQDKNTRSRPGKTSPPSAPKKPTSGSRPGGAQATKALKATR